MEWSKSRRADDRAPAERVKTQEAKGGRGDTKHFVAEMENKLGDFDARLKQRRQDLAMAEADISELERLVNAATQAIRAAQPTASQRPMSVVSDRQAPKAAAEG